MGCSSTSSPTTVNELIFTLSIASAPLVAVSEDDRKKAALKEKNRLALEKRKRDSEVQKKADQGIALPEGWTRTESRSRPGEMVYENTVTGERQAWFPDGPAVGAVGMCACIYPLTGKYHLYYLAYL